jgi:uncharacterized coiled-coil protein SlyX
MVVSVRSGSSQKESVWQMKTIEEIYKDQKKTVKDLNEIIYHLRMEIKRLQEIITEAKH